VPGNWYNRFLCSANSIKAFTNKTVGIELAVDKDHKINKYNKSNKTSQNRGIKDRVIRDKNVTQSFGLLQLKQLMKVY